MICKEKKIEKELTKDEKFNILKEYLSPIFSETMIKCFFKKGEWKTIRNFSEEDMCLALTIRGFSKKGYEYLRNKKIIPLPSLSTLQRHIKDFKLAPGILGPMIRLLEAWSLKLTSIEKMMMLFGVTNYLLLWWSVVNGNSSFLERVQPNEISYQEVVQIIQI